MNENEIILINPGGKPEMDALEKDVDHGIYMYPYSLLFLQNYLATKQVKSKIIDLYWQNPDELFDIVEKGGSLIIGVTAQTHSALRAIDIIQKIKRLNNNAYIVVGGNHFTYTAHDTLERFKEIDVVVRSEGEITFFELVSAIKNGKDIGAIDGITYRINGSIQENEDRKPERDLEQLSLKYDQLPIIPRFKEGILLRNYEKENYRSYPVFLGRGCSRKCAFCVYNRFMYRVRKIPSVLQEIDYLIKTYNAKYFTFADPSFCERKGFAKEFCETLISKYPTIKWSCEARVDTPIEILKLMAKAGCISVDFALESGSEKVLNAINKNIDLAKTIEFAKACKTLGIRSHVFLMLSLPEETEEDALLTLKACRELSKYTNSMSLAVTQILPGTELERLAFEKEILPKDFSYYDKRFFHQHLRFADAHVPLYFEHLDINFIDNFFDKIMDIKAEKYDSFKIILRKAKLGLLSLHKRPVKKNILYIKRFLKAVMAKIFNTKKRKGK